jgi:hypothetical protein
MFKLATFKTAQTLRIAIKELDYVLDAIWNWEESLHGRHTQRYAGGPVYEAVIELQEWLIKEDK